MQSLLGRLWQPLPAFSSALLTAGSACADGNLSALREGAKFCLESYLQGEQSPKDYEEQELIRIANVN